MSSSSTGMRSLRESFSWLPQWPGRLPSSAALLAVLTACHGRLEDASSITPMACASKVADSSGIFVSNEAALTRADYSTYKATGGDMECHLQPYIAYRPDELENLEADQVADAARHRWVGFAFPNDQTVGSAIYYGELAEANLTADCGEFGVPESAPLCVGFCPDWEGGSFLMITEDLCERVLEIDGKSTDEFGGI